MDGIGLDNMLGAEEVEKLFSDQQSVEETADNGDNNNPEENSETEEAAEVDFSDLLGNQPESVGSGEDTEGNRETPKSNSDSGTPQNNLFSSIAKALKDEGVFPDLSDESVGEVKDAATLRQMFDNEIAKMLDDTQKSIQQFIKGGATPDEVQSYQQAVNLSQYLSSQETLNTLTQEGEAGEKLRKQVMYQDYVNRGFDHDRAVRLVQMSMNDGSDIEDAKLALESCKKFYQSQVEGYQRELKERQEAQKANEKKQFDSLKKHILDTESFYDGVKVSKQVRQKAYDSITKPVYRDEQGNYMTALQKYQREHPIEFMENVALLYALTGEFKNVEQLAGSKAKAKIKSSFDELANVLNNSRRGDDGSLNLANTPADFSERNNWELAI